jgi:nucleotide-binding universal stress UspA family protein
MLSATTRKMFDRPDVEIVMLHAVEEPSRSGRGTEVAHAMAQMEFLASEKFLQAKVTRRAERGDAAECILAYAQRHAVDVIVMPAGGPQSLRRNSLGHVTEEVLSTAPCDVWIEWMTGSVESARHICCAVGLDGDDEDVLRRAVEIAGEFGAQLTIIHAATFEPPMALWWDTDAVDEDLRLARIQVDELRRRLAPTARTHVEAGRSDTVVSRVLHRLNAGLLIASRQGPALVAAAMACPVLRLASPMAELAVAGHPQYAGVLTRTA